MKPLQTALPFRLINATRTNWTIQAAKLQKTRQKSQDGYLEYWNQPRSSAIDEREARGETRQQTGETKANNAKRITDCAVIERLPGEIFPVPLSSLLESYRWRELCAPSVSRDKRDYHVRSRPV